MRATAPLQSGAAGSPAAATAAASTRAQPAPPPPPRCRQHGRQHRASHRTPKTQIASTSGSSGSRVTFLRQPPPDGSGNSAAAAGERVVTERRAADVAVLGGSMAATLAAVSLARSGKKVLLLPDFGLAAAVPAPRRLQALKLPDPDPLLVHLASEALPYWRGLELQAGTPLLAQQQSLDVVVDPERDHAGAAGFAALQEACAAAGVPASLLSGAEVAAAYRLLRLPEGRSSGLLQPDGAVIRAAAAAGAARQLATNAGVMVREGLQLQGWRDRGGSCFELRYASSLSQDLVSLYEAEVLLLAPGAWQAASLALFGLNNSVQGLLQAREVLRCRLATSAPELVLTTPLLQTWGSVVAADAPQQPQGLSLLPSGVAGDRHLMLQQHAAWGRSVEQPFAWRPTTTTLSSNLAAAQQQEQEQASSSAAWLQLQLAQLHASASQLVRGVAPLQPDNAEGDDADAAGSSSRLLAGSSVVSCTPDGRPLLTCHPGYDAGRVVLCCAASGSSRFGPGSSSAGGYGLSPVLAKLAADLIRTGGAPSSSSSSSSSSTQGDKAPGSSSGGDAQAGGGGSSSAVLQALSLHQRAASGQPQGASSGAAAAAAAAAAGQAGVDTWEGLAQLQAAAPLSALQQEEQQDLASDAARDLLGRQQ